MTTEFGAACYHSRGTKCPGDASFVTLEEKRAQGMPDAGRTHGPPATKNAGGSHHRFSRNNRHSLRDGLRLITRSPRRPGFDCLRRLKFITSRLDPSIGGPGPHAFAVRADA